MSKFEIGDEVTIIKGSKFDRGDDHNPSHGTKGIVVKTDQVNINGLNLRVEWLNGLKNSYSDEDLEHYEDRSNYHPHHDLIVAWAKGAKIQGFCTKRGRWVNIRDGHHPTWHPAAKFRIKPEELTPKQIEKQAIEEEMRKLADRLKELDC